MLQIGSRENSPAADYLAKPCSQRSGFDSKRLLHVPVFQEFSRVIGANRESSAAVSTTQVSSCVPPSLKALFGYFCPHHLHAPPSPPVRRYRRAISSAAPRTPPITARHLRRRRAAARRRYRLSSNGPVSGAGRRCPLQFRRTDLGRTPGKKR